MADELNKKPLGNKPASEPAPKTGSVSQPKMAPKQNAKSLSGAKIQPGSPYKSESVPVGVQQGKFESPKHAEKRVNKMFGETNQPTLGVWNKNNTHPMAKPDQVKVNPKFNYKPTQEQLDAANRKKIMSQGFAPNKNDDYYKNSPKGFGDTSKKLSEWGDKNRIYVNEKSTKNYYDEEPDFWLISGEKGDFSVQPNENGSYSFFDDKGGEIGSANNEEELFDYLNNWNSKDQNNRTNPEPGEEGHSWKADVLKNPKLLESDITTMMEQEPDKYDYDNVEGKDWNEYSTRKGNIHNDLYKRLINEEGFSPEEANQVLDAWLGTEEEDKQAWENAGYPINSSAKGTDDIPNVDNPQPQWNNENNPGSGVVTKELTDWVRNYLLNQVGEDYANTIAANLHKDHNMADFYKGLMKKDLEKKGGK